MEKVLGDNEWTGVTDIIIDPRDPNRMYAATWQRHRNVASYLGGGPNTAIYRSEDGGENWTKLKNGLPKSNMGKIGLAISPQKPDVVYAAIELDRTKGGVLEVTTEAKNGPKCRMPFQVLQAHTTIRNFTPRRMNSISYI